jgi:hypothetical protein
MKWQVDEIAVDEMAVDEMPSWQNDLAPKLLPFILVSNTWEPGLKAYLVLSENNLNLNSSALPFLE